MQRITSFFLFASGVDTALLKECPSETNKYVGIGATIFFTGVFAAWAAGYALFTVFNSYWIASLLGLVWGLMIFNLDRYIVSSMRKENNATREWIMASPRIVLAVAISLIIAKPLELKIFEKEIEPELVIMEQEVYLRQENETRNRFSPTLSSIQHQINDLKTEIFQKEQQRDALIKEAQQEADGTGGSRRRNLGPIYKLKKADADKAEIELQELTNRNSTRIRNLENDLNHQDSLLNASLMNLERNRRDGPAARLEALSRLTAQSSAIWWANVFIILLFIIVETAPIMVKLISKSGPYDNLLRIAEHQFICRETESVAVATAETKQRTSTLGQTEQTFVNTRLDAEIS